MTSVWPAAITVQMSFTTCCHDGCSVVFGMPKDLEARFRKSHVGFYCPYGHVQYFLAQSKEEELKQKIADLEQRAQNLIKREEWAKQETKLARYDSKVARSHAKRAVTISRQLRQRIKAGTCPCCETKFDNLEAHMKAEHPRYR